MKTGKAIVAVCLVFAAGCAAPAVKKSKSEFVNGDVNSSKNLKASDIEADLTRSDRPILAYTVTATYLTRPYIVASEYAVGRRNKYSDEAIDKTVATKLKAIEGKTCFKTTLLTGTRGLLPDIDTASFKSWRGTVEQPKGTFHDVTFQNMGASSDRKLSSGDILMSNAIVGEAATAASQSDQMAVSTGCANYKVDPLQPFTFHMIPQFGDERFKPAELGWK